MKKFEQKGMGLGPTTIIMDDVDEGLSYIQGPEEHQSIINLSGEKICVRLVSDSTREFIKEEKSEGPIHNPTSELINKGLSKIKNEKNIKRK